MPHSGQCSSCGQGPPRWRFADGRQACATCAQRQPCTFCGFPGIKTVDEFILCRGCLDRAVLTSDHAAGLVAQVEGYMSSIDLTLSKPITLKLQTLAGARHAGDYQEHQLGHTRYRSGGQTSEVHIQVRLGMPSEVTLQTIAHEFGHALLFEWGCHDASRIASEGFCEYLGFTCLGALMTGSAAREYVRRGLSRTDDYGRGYRLVRAAADRIGHKQVISSFKGCDVHRIGLP